ncbi:S-adenosyl-L-methionine-dependent methyltransferase [Lentinula lateritia]|uniref:S-adenosyl-L-methionine-dependent methyltransferase n=1 Tax=Lentinula aff. lateritia TaxID=2804960 RepID=A0ACC1TPT5_9AGAR|nr:S-adenosyl-L-methionine-dependent methyltransferase [Lentinula aff. lateritia]KAJ3848349.1 S-adenosyl-L-methionine-dependent methyltransferase [Lentinula lateritia]
MTGRSEVQALLLLISESAMQALHEYEKHGEALPSLYGDHLHLLDKGHTPILLKKAIRNLEGACDQLCSTLAPPLHTIVNVPQDYYWSCLRVAAHKKIADILDGNSSGVDIMSLVTETGIEQTKLTVIMRTLAARHCFHEVASGIYTNTRLSLMLHSRNSHTDFIDLLTTEGQQTAGHFQEYLDDVEYGQSHDTTHTTFTYSVKGSGFQGTVYDWMKANVMSRSMPSMNTVMGSLSIIKVFPWNRVKTVCDVGCGNGSFVWPLIQEFPNLHVSLFDLPETLEVARHVSNALCLSQELQNQLHFQSGNFFDDPLPKLLDIYYFRNVIHNWPDHSVLSILKSVRKVMGDQARVLIHEYTIHSLQQSQPEAHIEGSLDEAPWPLLPDFGYGKMRLHNQDLTMLFMYNARERTVEELQALSNQAGLTLNKIWDLGETTVLEFIIGNS